MFFFSCTMIAFVLEYSWNLQASNAIIAQEKKTCFSPLSLIFYTSTCFPLFLCILLCLLSNPLPFFFFFYILLFLHFTSPDVILQGAVWRNWDRGATLLSVEQVSIKWNTDWEVRYIDILFLFFCTIVIYASMYVPIYLSIDP